MNRIRRRGCGTLARGRAQSKLSLQFLQLPLFTGQYLPVLQQHLVQLIVMDFGRFEMRTHAFMVTDPSLDLKGGLVRRVAKDCQKGSYILYVDDLLTPGSKPLYLLLDVTCSEESAKPIAILGLLHGGNQVVDLPIIANQTQGSK